MFKTITSWTCPSLDKPRTRYVRKRCAPCRRSESIMKTTFTAWNFCRRQSDSPASCGAFGTDVILDSENFRRVGDQGATLFRVGFSAPVQSHTRLAILCLFFNHAETKNCLHGTCFQHCELSPTLGASTKAGRGGGRRRWHGILRKKCQISVRNVAP